MVCINSVMVHRCIHSRKAVVPDACIATWQTWHSTEWIGDSYTQNKALGSRAPVTKDLVRNGLSIVHACTKNC
jgi:hypothetical protein